jgi:fibronectin-binding autotransporter adhesin
MKPTHRLFSAVVFAGSVLFAEKALSQTYYLDVNGTTEGSGIAGAGSYNVATSIWTTVADGTGTAVAHVGNKPYVIAAGSDAAGLSFNLTGTLQQPSNLTIEEGFVTIDSTLDTFRSPTIQTNDGTSLAITSPNLRATASFNTLGNSSLDLFRISNNHGVATTFIKNGPGLLVVNNNASNIRPSFVSTINNGTVRIRSGNAFYLSDSRLTLITLTINNGGTLELDNNITVAGNPITINGPGFNNGTTDLGAIANAAGSNSYNSLITLGSACRINNNAQGTLLTLNPSGARAITGGHALTIGGTGDVTVSKSIEFIPELAKDGAGTLTLSASNIYQGATTVHGGKMVAGSASPFGDSTAAVTVNPGGVLDLAGQTLTAGKAFTLAGGSLINSAGTSTLETAASATVVNGGSYAPETFPNVGVGGPGSGAAVDPLMRLKNTTVTNLTGGSGYSSTATATFTAAPSGGSTATATLSFGLTQASINSISGGTGWAVGDAVTLNGGTVPAQATVSSINSGAITGLTLTTPGSGYTAAPTGITKVTSATGNVTGVTLTANATNFTVTSVNVTSQGSGYIIAPSLVISAPNSGGTQATSAPNSAVYALSFSNGGTGYTSAPTVTLSGGIVDATAIGGFASIQLTADSSMGGVGDMVVNPAISSSGAFGLTKIGAGSLSLTATNSYSGNTVVNEGTLSLGNGATNTSLANSADVVVAPGAILNLNYTGTDTIDQLTLAGVQVEPGIYGSSHSSNRIIGTGTLTVLNGPSASSAYDTWAITTHGLSGGNAAFDFDFENDGLANGLEWILGGNPKTGAPTVSPLAGRDLSGNLVLQFTREEEAITESTLTLQYATDLDGTWANSFVIDADGGTDANGVIVLIDQIPDPDTVVVTIPATATPGGKAFARLKATKP